MRGKGDFRCIKTIDPTHCSGRCGRRDCGARRPCHAGTGYHAQCVFRVHAWEDHFDAIGLSILLSDTSTRVFQHWTPDGEMRIYLTSVPLTDDLTRRGYTEVVEKRENPNWTPTPSMRERNPEWPPTIAGGDPLNPLGIGALYLSWQFYRIHGTADTRKIGRRSSNGCIGLYNEQIEEVYLRAPIGTQVKLL